MAARYRSDIDGLRAVAIMPVVLYHAGLGLRGGYLGVDVFFVISGYLIIGLIHREMVEGRFSFLDFYARRVRRLYPALFLTFAATTAWAAVRMLWVDLVDYAESLLSVLVYASNIYFYAQTGYFTEAATIKPLLHTWSLAVEEQFYLVAPPLMLLLVARFSLRGRVALLVLLVALAFLACVVMTGRDRNAAFYLAPFRAWELGLGGVLALVRLEWLASRRWLAEVLGIAGLALIAYAVFALHRYLPMPGWRAAVPCLGAAMVIAAGMAPGTLVGRLLGASVPVLIGKISYPLYLWHWPVIVVLVYGRPEPLGPGMAVLAIAVSFALAYATWRWIETPVRTRRAVAGRREILAGGALASVAAALAAGSLILAKGLPGRHPPELVAMVESRGLLDSARWLHDHRRCHFSNPAVLAQGNPCVLGAEGVAPTFALVGDSHADAASPAVFAAAARAGVSGYQITMPGFIPTPGRWFLGTGADTDVQAVLRFLHDRPEVETILVTAWWVRARIGESYRDEPAVYVDAEYDGSGPAYNPASFDRAMARLAEALPDRRIVLLDDVPAGPALDMKIYVRRYATTGAPPPPGLPRTAADRQRVDYEPALSALAARYANLDYVPVFAGLCSREVCPLFDANGNPVFRDGDHLSNVGALSLTDAVAEIFAR